MVVGYNHRFGYKKEGDYDFLESRECGFEVFRVEQHQVASSKVSSTIIRQALSRGMLDKAARLLGHPYVVACELQSTGEVVIDRNKLLPPAGCYAARVNGQIGEVTIGAEREMSFSVKPVDGKVIVEFI
jgi:FAD synthase